MGIVGCRVFQSQRFSVPAVSVPTGPHPLGLKTESSRSVLFVARISEDTPVGRQIRNRKRSADQPKRKKLHISLHDRDLIIGNQVATSLGELRHRRSAGIEPHEIAAVAFGLIESLVGGVEQILANQLRIAGAI
jgi:hypothetical protein